MIEFFEESQFASFKDDNEQKKANLGLLKLYPYLILKILLN